MWHGIPAKKFCFSRPLPPLFQILQRSRVWCWVENVVVRRSITMGTWNTLTCVSFVKWRRERFGDVWLQGIHCYINQTIGHIVRMRSKMYFEHQEQVQLLTTLWILYPTLPYSTHSPTFSNLIAGLGTWYAKTIQIWYLCVLEHKDLRGWWTELFLNQGTTGKCLHSCFELGEKLCLSQLFPLFTLDFQFIMFLYILEMFMFDSWHDHSFINIHKIQNTPNN